MNTQIIQVPDIGDFENVEVIEVLVQEGDQIQAEDSLITIESDKASMEIPAPLSGVVKKMRVKLGDRVSEGSDILELAVDAASTTTRTNAADTQKPEPTADPSIDDTNTKAKAPTSLQTQTIPNIEADIQADVVVLGSGPGGYTAAFRAADLGKQVVLIEKYDQIGGVCLNVGCIPSKALLHVAEVISESREFSSLGVSFGEPDIDIDKLRAHKNKVVKQLTGGLKQLAKQRKVTIVKGYGRFLDSHHIEAQGEDNSKQIIGFAHCIIAAGSRVTKLPFIPWDDPRVWDSTDALQIPAVPKRLLVIGGGIIGLEMATVYHALGSQITIVELGPGLIPGVDRDMLRSYERTLKKRYEQIYLNTRVSAVTPVDEGLQCTFEAQDKTHTDTFDFVLVAIGRQPNGQLIDAEKAGVSVDAAGFIPVDSQQRTNVDHIFAIGDIVGQPMLAHKATHEGKIAAEVISGEKRHFDARVIPAVAYTDPEVAWCGQTEEQLKQAGIAYERGVFPWVASGRAISMGAQNGMTKVLYDADSKRLLGATIVGKNAGELIAETALAIEMGAEIDDVALTIHPHPTLSETVFFATEVAEGSCTDIYAPKKAKKKS